MNILLSTFGQTWQLVPELVGLVNRHDVPLYDNYPNTKQLLNFRLLCGNAAADEVWLVLTNDKQSLAAFDKVELWHKMLAHPHFVLRKFVCQSASQLADADECRTMTDYILRVVLAATEALDGGNLLLSLAGGRKTMSADLQRAASLFGCRLLFHVADNLKPDSLLRQRDLDPALLTGVLPQDQIAGVFPVVVAHNLEASLVASLPNTLTSKHFPVEQAASNLLLIEIEKREKQTRNLLHSAYIDRRRSHQASYFHGLQLLPPQLISQLESQHIGLDRAMESAELSWLRSLPKADLHCHLGGVLTVQGMVDAALANREAVEKACLADSLFKHWLKEVETAVKQHDSAYFGQWIGQWKKLRGVHQGWPASTTVSGFLSAFQNDSGYLDSLLYGSFLHESCFNGAGITAYEALGDLQGSALLGSEAALRFTLQYLVSECAMENITYCEVRCSPAKYASAAMPIEKVMQTIRSELSRATHTHFKLIIIASRHAPMEEMAQHVNLVSSMVNEEGFDDWFAGFDLAGDEQKMKPGELREVFDPLLRDCVNVTIHAGETAPVSNIWEAAYMLQADRIGHGLTLKNDPRLMKRFADRGIAIEMCPSSNYQIVGFADNYIPESRGLATYPLRYFMENNLAVTLNTDNRGISRTTLSEEYLKAARLTAGGLSRWEVLQLVRNGFKSAFVGRQMRKQYLIDSEEQLLKILLS